MAIVKRTKKDGSVYYFNTVTKKFAAKLAGKKSEPAKRKTNCSLISTALRTNKTSAAGRKLRCDCRTKRPCKSAKNYM